MTMAARGYAKLIEELGELLQVLGKRLAYYTTNEHPDGGKPLNERMEDEIADVLAACVLVMNINPELRGDRIIERRGEKIQKFLKWHDQQHNNDHAIDYRHPRGL